MRNYHHSRRGTVLPMMAVSLTMLVAMLAFTVDIGYLVSSRMELQNVADSAALAGARKISTATGDATVVKNACIAEAQRVAQLNKCGQVAIKLSTNDILVGNIANPNDPASPFIEKTPYNSVQVTARRDSSQNGALSLFFAPLLGQRTTDVRTTAVATNGGGYVKGFKFAKDDGSQTCLVLPFALDVNTWNDAVNGVGPDVWRYDAQTKQVSAGSDGMKEIKLFPTKTTSPGNFGTVNLGQTNNSTSILNRQILYGPTPADMANMGGQIALGNDGKLLLTGNPGISAGMSSALNKIIGQPRILPLYVSPVALNSAKAQYTVVGFAGVIITKVQLSGTSKYITIQPQRTRDLTAFSGGPVAEKRYVDLGRLQLTR